MPAIIAQGVNGGEMVVTDGADKLRNGTSVDPRAPNQGRPNRNQGNQNGTMGQ